MAKKPALNPAAFLVKRAEQQQERREEVAAQAPVEDCAHLQVKLAYEDYELVRRVARRDLKVSIQSFLVEAISARLQELGHTPIRDPGLGRRGRE